MKTLILALLFACIGATLPIRSETPKPPVGVPNDAKFFKGKWFRYYAEKTTWQRARTRCEALGGKLASIPDAETWAFVHPLCRGHTWLGGSNETSSGWIWLGGAKVTFAAWAEGEPNNRDRVERYMIASEGKWNDVAKDNPSVTGYICEWAGKL